MHDVLFQSTRPVRGATCEVSTCSDSGKVSIHAPRAGRDCMMARAMEMEEFQSTRPVRGATWIARRPCLSLRVSIHAPRAGRDCDQWTFGTMGAVSIHAPRAGRDPHASELQIGNLCFNPRAPCGARRLRFVDENVTVVSIHAPRAGRDRGSAAA